MTDNYNIEKNVYYYNTEKSEEEVQEKYNELVKIADKFNMSIATMESCTAGYIGHLIKKSENAIIENDTIIKKNNQKSIKPIYKGTNVVYSNVAKNAAGVSRKTTDRHTVYSSITVGRMATEVYKNFDITNEDKKEKDKEGIVFSITGTAGNKDDANWSSEPGEIYLEVKSKNYIHKRKIYLNPTLGKIKTKIIIADAISNLFAEALLEKIKINEIRQLNNPIDEGTKKYLENLIEISKKYEQEKEKKDYSDKCTESMKKWIKWKQDDRTEKKNKFTIPMVKDIKINESIEEENKNNKEKESKENKNNIENKKEKILKENKFISDISKELKSISNLNFEKKMSFEELFKEDNKDANFFNQNDILQGSVTIADKYKIKIFGIELINKRQNIYADIISNKFCSGGFLLGADVYNDAKLFKKKILNNKKIDSDSVKYVTKLAQDKCKLDDKNVADLGYSIIEDDENNKVFVAVYSNQTKKVELKEIDSQNKNLDELEKKINSQLEKLIQKQVIEIANIKRNVQKYLVNKNKLERLNKSIETFIKFNPLYKKKELNKIDNSVKNTLKKFLNKENKIINNNNNNNNIGNYLF